MHEHTELCQLAETYGVDKCPHVSHSYTPKYHQILSQYRNSMKKVVEIGIGNYQLMAPIVGPSYKHGASLRMWRDYFPNATIIGCDILTSVLFNDEPRIDTYLVDQSSLNSLISFGKIIGNVDMIVDDGSHYEDHMILSFHTLWKCIIPNGIYIIEDIQKKSINKFANIHTVLGLHDVEVLCIHPGNNDWDGFIAFRKTE